MKTDIASLSFDELSAFVAEMGLPKFRAGQIYRNISRGILDFNEMTDLSLDLRKKLDESAQLPVLNIKKKLVDSDGTVKYLFELYDGALIEAVVMNYKHGNSVCISSQVGCRMACAFCASSLHGLQRSLTAGEMYCQVALLNKLHGVSSIVIMGIGEPLDNYDNLLRFLRTLKDERGMNMSHRHVSVSTCGLVPKILELANEKLQITLSISLHAPDNETRSKIMPVNKSYDVAKLISACKEYIRIAGRRISFEYTLIKGINDRDKHAETLTRLLKGMLCHVNLINVNYVEERGLQPTSPERVKRFGEILTSRGINTTLRRSLGKEINAACGQLRQTALKEN